VRRWVKNTKNCFWCDKKLDYFDRTRDHFISRSLWRLRSVENRGPSCCSCHFCNMVRGKISELSNLAHLIKKKVVGKKAHKTFRKMRRGLLDHMLNFRNKIERAAIHDDIKTLCLWEIDEALRHDVDYEQVRLRAYFLWDKAGRPHGRHEDFWLLAERQIITEA